MLLPLPLSTLASGTSLFAAITITALSSSSPVIAQSVPNDGEWQPVNPEPIEIPAENPSSSNSQREWQPVNPEPISPEDGAFPLEATLVMPIGETIGAVYTASRPLYLNTNESRTITLEISHRIRDRAGNVLIPRGSLLTGEIRPVQQGARFFAESLQIGEILYPIQARSIAIEEQRDPRQVSVGAVAQDAAIGAGVGLVLAAITGDRAIATEEVLGAAAAGAVIGNVTAPNVIAISKDMPLNLTVTEDFYMN